MIEFRKKTESFPDDFCCWCQIRFFLSRNIALINTFDDCNVKPLFRCPYHCRFSSYRNFRKVLGLKSIRNSLWTQFHGKYDSFHLNIARIFLVNVLLTEAWPKYKPKLNDTTHMQVAKHQKRSKRVY